MQVFRGSRAAARSLSGSAITIGNFDGVHLGHQALFRQVTDLARASGLPALALTFDPHPARFFRPELAPPLINTEAQKLELLAHHALDIVVVEPFDEALAQTSAEDFAAELLARRLGARHVVVGHGFVFGHNRTGQMETLHHTGAQRGFVARELPLVESASMVVSSTKVREFVLLGRVEGAADLMGRPHFIDGEVVTGAGRGATIGVPTANLHSDNELIPGRGVYSGWASAGPWQQMPAVINVGFAPTFGPDRKLGVEAHLLDFDHPLLGQRMRLEFVERLRDEQRFSSGQALVAAIRHDIEQARSRLGVQR